VQMIDSSTVRVHQHASGVKKGWRSLCGPKPRGPHHEDPRAGRRERAPICLLISPGQVHDVSCAEALLDGIAHCAVAIADKGYDADRVRARIRAQGAILPTAPTGRRNSDGRRHSIASATSSSGSSTSSSSSDALPRATTSSALRSSLSSSSPPCEFGSDQLSPRH
jgi:hypothetical protein